MYLARFLSNLLSSNQKKILNSMKDNGILLDRYCFDMAEEENLKR